MATGTLPSRTAAPKAKVRQSANKSCDLAKELSRVGRRSGAGRLGEVVSVSRKGFSLPSLQTGSAGPVDVEADLLVVAATKGNHLGPAAQAVDDAMDGALRAHLDRTTSGSGSSVFDGSAGNLTTLPTLGRTTARSVMVVGLGDAGKLTLEQVRRAAGCAARAAGGYRSVALDIAAGLDGAAVAAAEGFLLGAHTFDRYLSTKPGQPEQVTVVGASDAELERATVYSRATIWARDLVNQPPSERGPQVVAEQARRRAEEAGVQVEILDQEELAARGMNGLITVGKGSSSPPCLLLLTYSPEDAQETLGLVGKGITFDSGGLSLKTSEGMETMKMDCSGAAAVIAAMTSLPALQPRVQVVAAVALAENMPGPGAVKPGDIIRHYGGKTSEVLNTDAEGRLVLADALAWMAERRPAAMVDVATLTGAVMVALGRRVAGLFANREDLSAELLGAAGRTGEALWAMPLVDEYRSLISTPVADVKNMSGTRHGGAVTAALFLREFVGDVPWAHLDIAGTAWVEKPDHYLSAGASGYGARLLLDWIVHRSRLTPSETEA